MALQTQIYSSVAAGVPGSRADANIFDYYPQSLTAEGDITAGTFVWPGSDAEAEAGYGGTCSPIGLVERSMAYPAYAVKEADSLIISEGETLSIATRGAFYVTSTSAATVGQAVFALSADGSIVTGAPASSISGAVETPWSVVTAGDAGETIIIKRS